jgi:hypothetical protein
MNTIEYIANPIESLKTSPYQFSADEQYAINNAVKQLEEINKRSLASTASAISNAARNVCDQYARGEVSLAEMLAISLLVTTNDDSKAVTIANNAGDSLARQQRIVLRDVKPLVMAAMQHRAEEIRQKCNDLEQREQQDSENSGIPHEASDLLRRLQATFRVTQARFRELRDSNMPPSKAELKELL